MSFRSINFSFFEMFFDVPVKRLFLETNSLHNSLLRGTLRGARHSYGWRRDLVASGNITNPLDDGRDGRKQPDSVQKV